MTMLKRVSEKRIFDFDRKAVGFWMEVDPRYRSGLCVFCNS